MFKAHIRLTRLQTVNVHCQPQSLAADGSVYALLPGTAISPLTQTFCAETTPCYELSKAGAGKFLSNVQRAMK